MGGRKIRRVLAGLEHGDLVSISWFDAYNTNGWISPSEVKERMQRSPGLPVVSVGFLVAVKNGQVAVTHSATEEGAIADPLVIPLSWIGEVKKL